MKLFVVASLDFETSEALRLAVPEHRVLSTYRTPHLRRPPLFCSGPGRYETDKDTGAETWRKAEQDLRAAVKLDAQNRDARASACNPPQKSAVEGGRKSA